ncbi:MAG: hypothetical protein RIS79_4135 [Verrucomicrobiota bacterium]
MRTAVREMHAADPRDDAKIREDIEKSLHLLVINGRKCTIVEAGAEMREKISNAVLFEFIRHWPHHLHTAKACGVAGIFTEPRVRTEPAMLHPNSVRAKVVPAVTQVCSRLPIEIGNFRKAKNCACGEESAPGWATAMIPDSAQQNHAKDSSG